MACLLVVSAWRRYAAWYRGRCYAGKLLLPCDKAREILADTSTRFGHFREMLLAMEGRADANGLAVKILLLRAIRSRGDRILQNAGFNHMLTMAVLRSRLLLPGAGITPERIKRDENALQLVKPTGSDPFGVQTHQHQGTAGELLGSSPREKGVYTRRWESAIILLPWARAGRSIQRRGVQRLPRPRRPTGSARMF